MNLKYKILLLKLILLISILKSQNTGKYFEINGSFENNIDECIIKNCSVKLFYNRMNSMNKVPSSLFPIKNNKFKINGFITAPELVMLSFYFNRRNIESNWFYIDTGFQNISIKYTNSNHDRFVVQSNSTSFLEDRSMSLLIDSIKSKIFIREKNNIIDSSQKNYQLANEMDSFLLNKIYLNRNSSIYVDILTSFIYDYGYKPIFDTALINLSKTLQNSKTGVELKNKLKYLKESMLTLPDLNLVDTKYLKTNIYKYFKAKYILVDFWFQSCQYCIDQFPQLKRINEHYQNQGFQIIGVSTDLKRFRDDWKKSISTFRLPWTQLLDQDHIYTSLLNINYFPSNYLISKNGTIIKKNIELNELDKFLCNELK